MSTEIIVAVVGAVALLGGAVLTWKSSHRSADHGRIRSLEQRVDKLERKNNILWRYARELVDHIYRNQGPPPPPWPDALLEETP